tara:strand:- start:29222 stop:29785 length:564 start_codon:yes stop_codon:yes gene_type:complete
LQSARDKGSKKDGPQDADEAMGGRPQTSSVETVVAASAKRKKPVFAQMGLLGCAIVAALAGGLWIYDKNQRAVSPSSQQQAASKQNFDTVNKDTDAKREVAKKIAPATKPSGETQQQAALPTGKDSGAVSSAAVKTTKVTEDDVKVIKSLENLSAKELTELANRGNNAAQFELANRHLAGKGFAKSP